VEVFVALGGWRFLWIWEGGVFCGYGRVEIFVDMGGWRFLWIWEGGGFRGYGRVEVFVAMGGWRFFVDKGGMKVSFCPF
jgi:hypothetical protein